MAQQSMRRDRKSQLGPVSVEGRGVDWVRSTNTIRARLLLWSQPRPDRWQSSTARHRSSERFLLRFKGRPQMAQRRHGGFQCV